MLSPWKRYRGLLIVLAVAGVLILFFLFSRSSGSDSPFETVSVARGDLTHVVSVTGRVEPATRTELAFDTSGRVERIQAEVGVAVEQGETLLVLDSAVLRARLAAARAEVERAEAVRAELLAGSRSEDTAVVLASVERREIELLGAAKELAGIIERALVLTEDEIREQVDQLYESTQPGDAEFGITLTQGSTKYYIQADMTDTLRLNTYRNEVTERFEKWEALVALEDSFGLGERAQAVEEHLAYTQRFLGELAGIITDLEPDTTIEQSIYDNFKSDISGARVLVSGLLTELRTALEAYDVAKAGKAVADRELARSEASARSETIRIEDANIAKARATVSELTAELDRTFVIAPLAGIVTALEVEVGEVVSPGELVVSVMANDQFELTAFIPEADIAEVELGAQAEVTLDAFERSRVFTAEVIAIAPAETILDGVPTYETTLVFSGESSEVKSGMTAEIDILTSAVEGVLMVPGRSLILEDGQQKLRVVVDETNYETQPVRVGLRGSNGMVEIREGVSEDEQIVLFVEE